MGGAVHSTKKHARSASVLHFLMHFLSEFESDLKITNFNCHLRIDHENITHSSNVFPEAFHHYSLDFFAPF